MLTTEIIKELTSLYSGETPYESVLFDGPWGCGKTYNIQRFLARDKSINYIYISLFGVDSVNGVVIRLAEKLESQYVSNFDGDYFINSVIESKPYNHCLIIFDDLERKHPDLKFETIFGIVESLRKLGFRVVSVINSAQITNRDTSFQEFTEKTFDRIFGVEADPQTLSDMIGDANMDTYKAYLSDAKQNLRLIFKTKTVCESLQSYMQSHGKDDYLNRMGLSSSLLFRCVLLAEKCLYSQNTNEPVFAQDDFSSYQYQGYMEEFGKKTANELFQTFWKKDEENQALKEPTLLLIRCIKEGNYGRIINTLYPSEKNSFLSEPPFNSEPFFLDDESKKNYKETFFKRISEFDFDEEPQKRLLVRVINVFANTLSEAEKSLIEDRLIKTIPQEKRNSFLEEMFPFIGSVSESMWEFKKRLKGAFLTVKEKETNDKFEKALRENDYLFLTDFLYKNRPMGSNQNSQIADLLAKHDFGLPDLSKTIDYVSWQYCHEVAHYVALSPACREAFIACLRAQCENSSSISLRERCNSLIRGELDDKLDFFELYPVK